LHLNVKERNNNRKILAFCGKGGAGKTAISAMMAGVISRADPSSRTLLIDADPAGGLAFAMGVDVKKTVGEVREEVIRQARTKDPAAKEQIASSIDYYVLEALEERGAWSLLAMGRGEAIGCFCPVNTLLREAIAALAGDFDRIIIDGEAGIEQIMRQVMKTVDTLVAVSDLSVRGLNTASLIHGLVQDKGILSAPEVMLVINRADQGSETEKAAVSAGFEAVYVIPQDPLVSEYDAKAKPLAELPPDAPSMKAVSEIARKLFFDG